MSNDGRRDPRQPTTLVIRFKSATLNEFVEKHSRDVSRGGVFIKTGTPMPSGTLIKFAIKLDNDDSLIEGVGRVVWRRLEEADADTPAGMGIKFIKLDDKSRQNLETILDSKTASAGTGGEAPEVNAVESPSLSEAPQSGIAPARPAAVPKDAKSTMLGMGPSSGIAPVRPSMSPGKSSVAPVKPVKPSMTPPTEDAKTPAADLEEGAVEAGSSEAPPAARASDDVVAEETAAVSVSRDSDGDSTGQIEEDQNKGALVAKTSLAPAPENELLSDISSAIDKALGEEEQAAAAEASFEETESSDDEKKESLSGGALDDAKPASRGQNETAVEAAAVGSARAGMTDVERKGSPVIWVLLVVFIAGAAAWYFLLGPGVVGGRQDTRTDDATRSASSAGGAVATEPASESSEGIGASNTKKTPPPVESVKLTTISVSTTPSGAKVYLDGELQQGETPLELEDIRVGREAEIRVQMLGYKSVVEKIVPGEKTVPIELELPKLRGKLVVESVPSGAAIVLDGRWAGKTPRELVKEEIPEALSYKVSLRGFDNVAGTISVDDWVEEDEFWLARISAEFKKDDESTPALAPAKPAVKPAPKPKAKPAPKPKAKPAPKVEAKPVPKPKPAPKVKAKPEPKPKAKPEPKPKAKPAPKKKLESAIDENPF